MKDLLKIIFTAFAAAALSLPALAQEEDAPLDEAPAQAQTARPAAPAEKKPAVKKKAVKKKKPAPVSEYKFASTDPTPTYKFDKKADPILKPVKKKKKTKAPAAGSAAGASTPKLKKVKSIGEEDAPDTSGLPAAMTGAGQ